MYTKQSEIGFRDMTVLGETLVCATEPLTFSVSDGRLMRFSLCGGGAYRWKESQYLSLEVELRATSRTFIEIAFFSGERQLVRMNYSIIPNKRVTVTFALSDLQCDHWFLTPHPGNLKGHLSGRPAKLDEIDRVTVTSTNTRDGETLTLYRMWISDTLPEFHIEGTPVVDRFGQNNGWDWSGKIHSEEELIAFLHREYRNSLKQNGYGNPEWDRFGGWKKLRFDATGYFHTHFDGSRWWLVDPDGYAFLSNGVVYGTRMGVHGFVDGMTDLFEWLPEETDPHWRDAWTTANQIPEYVKRNGEEAGRTRRMFNFARANMIRAFGDEWWDAWVTINSARLKKWGFNTVSVGVNNYFDERVEDYLAKAKVPYTWTMKRFPKTKKMIFRDFPDVFSPEYAELCRVFAEQLRPFSDDPYMIGYFITNEPEWMVARGVNLARQMFLSDRKTESRKMAVKFLSEKYRTIDALNRAWGQSFHGFDDFLLPRTESELQSAAAEEDICAIRDLLIAEYNRVPNEEIRRVDPNHMSLGMRFAGIQEKSDFSGAENGEVFSFNCYKKDPNERVELVNRYLPGKPAMIGEWMFGASDESLFCSALITLPNQTERGEACRRYLERVFANPQMVGAHYFEWNDQPLLGRFDGEAMPHGLITVCNQPKETVVAILTEVNERLYDIAIGASPETPAELHFQPSF